MTERARSGRMVYGVGPVRELLARRARDIAVLYVSSLRGARHGDAVAELGRDARSRGVTVEEKSRGELDALAGQARHHQGAVAIAGEYPYADLDDILARPRTPDQPAALWLALDSVHDPHNLGAIVRSAHLLGVDGVIIAKDRAAQVTATVTKVSAGATEHLPICRVTNLVRALDTLAEAGLWRAALATGEGCQPISALDGSGPLCLVVGAEGAGLRPLVARTCDHRVTIPMASRGVGSFNVSVAAAIALYEITRQRTRPGAASS